MQAFYLWNFFSISVSVASPVNSISEVGPHYPLFKFEKNENPQNFMVIYSKANADCHLQMANNQPVFDTYWLMDGKNYKKVHRLIKKGIRERLEVVPAGKKDSFFVKLHDLDEVQSDIGDARVRVSSEKSNKDCNLSATITLGPSDQNKTIRLQKLYSDSTKTIKPPFRKIKSITLSGLEIKTGEKVERTYQTR